jgi:hypothetical protein
MVDAAEFLFCMLVVIALGIRASMKEDKEKHHGRGR